MGGVTVALRADRSPPERVRTVDDLADLGDALAAGDAESEARHLLEEALAARSAWIERLTSTSLTQWQRRVRASAVELVRQAINAELILRRRQGADSVDPILVWLDLKTGSHTAWRNIENFLGWLGLTSTDVVPLQSPTDDEQPDNALRSRQMDAADRLVSLMREWTTVTKRAEGR
jgi:hypothetical protein